MDRKLEPEEELLKEILQIKMSDVEKGREALKELLSKYVVFERSRLPESEVDR